MNPRTDPLIIAHRGAMQEAPENSKPAFDKALAYGAHGFEFDVQITRDHCPVIFHDQSLAKISKSLKSIPDFTFQELSSMDWGGWFSEEFIGQTILTLEQVLISYGARTRLMIEIKTSPLKQHDLLYDYLAGRVAESVRNLIPRDLIPNMFILSFDPDIIKSAYLNDPNLNYVLNLETPLTDPDNSNIDPEILCGYCIEYTELSREFVENVHHEEKIVMTYSCNSEDTLDQLLDLGIDVIMTDDPGHPMWKPFALRGRG